MNSILRLMISKVFQADPDAIGGSGDSASEESQTTSMDDTIGALFDKMEAEGHEDESTAGDAPVVEAPPASRSRDATGKFAKSSTDTGAPDASAPATAATEPAKQSVETAPAVAATQFAEPPKSWNAAEKAAWANAPEAVRAAAHRREEDFHRGLEGYRAKAQNFDALHEVISPHAQIFQQTGQTAIENVGALLNLQQVLYTGADQEKVGALLQICEQSGIKPEALLEGLRNPQSRPAQDPRYDSLARETQQLRQLLTEVQQKPVLSQVEQFFADTKNEWINEPGVKDRMLIEIQSGAVSSLQEAYDNACQLNRSVQTKVSAQKAEADRKAQAERDAAEAKRKADLAANAKRASSINVKPRGATAGPAAKGTMDDTIGAEYDRIVGRNG